MAVYTRCFQPPPLSITPQCLTATSHSAGAKPNACPCPSDLDPFLGSPVSLNGTATRSTVHARNLHIILDSFLLTPHHEARSILPHALGHLHLLLHISTAAIISYLDNHKSHLPGPPWSAPPSQPIPRTAARETFFIFFKQISQHITSLIKTLQDLLTTRSIHSTWLITACKAQPDVAPA